MIRCAPWTLAPALVFAALWAHLAPGQEPADGAPEEALAGSVTSVGIEGTAAFEHPRSDLVLVPGSERDTVLARLVGRTALASGGTRYELRFVAVRPGLHDLAALVVTPAGEAPAGLGPIRVRVRSLLPDDHTGELETLAGSAPRVAGRFRLVAGVVALLWLVPLALAALRRARRRPAPPVAAPPLPTLADQLRPLVERALAGTATRAERARLERLLLAHWSRHLGLAGLPPGAALARLRNHSEAGALLRAVEGWLHARGAPAGGPAELSGVLEPYRSAPRIEEPGPEAVR